MNPFEQKPSRKAGEFQSWKSLYPKAYSKDETDAYTKVRIILMTGAEYEAVWFGHQFHRHCTDNDLRRELAVSRRQEQQQQHQLAYLKPADETQLETTITYEQLAVDLTAILAQRDPDPYVVKALNFALLEDFDHLYRYADLLEMEQGIRAERLVGGYTEIMPGRPTIAHHRHPVDSVRRACDFKKADLLTMLDTCTITAAEQQTMNYYMNVANLYQVSDIGRKMYQEIGMIEEEHVSQYESLMDPRATWLESLLLHEYTECYLYYSCMMTECDPSIRRIWEDCLTQEISHLHMAKELLWKYEQKEYQQVVGEGTLPEILALRPNIQYVRKVIELALDGQVDATVTNPLNKEAMNLAGHHFSGHTEIYAHYTGARHYTMMLAHKDLRVVHVSTHVSLREACDRVTRERVLEVIRIADKACRDMGIAQPRIGVAGLNPHCGEGGLFGREEIEQISPAIADARQDGIDAQGPIPPDTVFSKALGGWYDMVVAMYHDQGHIPLKVVGFVYDREKGSGCPSSAPAWTTAPPSTRPAPARPTS